MTGTASPKPLKGTALMERRAKRRSRVTAEERVMREAKRRDRNRCRWPNCQHRDLPVDACHQIHRGMGGNPAGDRTTVDQIVTLCRFHHGLYDRGDVDIRPMWPREGMSGPVLFFERTARLDWLLVGGERGRV